MFDIAFKGYRRGEEMASLDRRRPGPHPQPQRVQKVGEGRRTDEVLVHTLSPNVYRR